MQITIDIADKLAEHISRTYSYNAESGITLQQHLENYFSDQIYREVRQNVENVEREKFAAQSTDAILTKSDIKPAAK